VAKDEEDLAEKEEELAQKEEVEGAAEAEEEKETLEDVWRRLVTIAPRPFLHAHAKVYVSPAGVPGGGLGIVCA